MSKAFGLWDGSAAKYVDDPAGGRALNLDGTFRVFAHHQDFGNVTLFPAGGGGDVTMTWTVRASIDMSDNSGFRELFVYQPGRFDGSSWEFPTGGFSTRIRWYLDDNTLFIRTHNTRGGQAGGFTWTRLFNANQYFDGTWHEIRWQAHYKSTSGASNTQTLWIDGAEIPVDLNSWIDKSLDFSVDSGDPVFAHIVTGNTNSHNSAIAKVSAFRIELKDNS